MPETAEIASDPPWTETPRYRTVCRTSAQVEPSPNGKSDLLRVSEVAIILRVSPTTIYRIMRLGELQCVHVGPRSMRHIPRTSFEAFTARKLRLAKASECNARRLLVTDAGRGVDRRKGRRG
jgi:excisionase family DNA binding protein